MKVENLKFIKLSLIIMSLLFMFSFASVTCFAQDSSDQKAPPSVTVQRNDPTGDFAVLPSDNVESWVGSITSVTVNGISYSKGYVTWNQRWNDYGEYGAYGWQLKGITIGEGWGNNDTGVCIISASGYDDLILILNKDSYTGSVHTTHSGGTATCQKQAKCEICGQAYGELTSHTFTNYVSDGNAGCTEDGTKTAICDVCRTASDTVTDEGSATGHSYGSWADCKDGENHKHTCQTCGHEETEAHRWDDGKVIKEPGASEKGEKTYTCSVCGAEKTETLPASGEENPGTPSTPDDTKNPENPTVPDDTKSPETPADTKKPVKDTSPKTGDASSYILWITLLAASAAGMTAIIIFRKQKTH